MKVQYTITLCVCVLHQTFPPSMTVEVNFSLAVALLRTISSTESLVTSLIIFTGLVDGQERVMSIT